MQSILSSCTTLNSMMYFFLLQNYLTLLDDEDHRLEYLKIQDEQHLVIEGMQRIIDCSSKNRGLQKEPVRRWWQS